MKKSALVILILGFVFGIWALSAGQSGSKTTKADKSLQWLKYDVALEKAKKENKPVMVFFTTSWCTYCKKMKKYTFTDDGVYSLMSEDFILAVVDGDSKYKVKVTDKAGKASEITEKQLSQAFGIRGFPTTVFLKANGTTIAPIPGFWPADRFFLALKFISTDAYEKMSFQAFAEKQKG
jgi:thioredoxin-related protein